jgi:sortase A
VSELFGRRATYGAPFAHLAQLRPGDTISAVTGQGIAIYRVAAVANSTHLIKDPVANRLVLVTASSPVIPAYFIEADARLISRVHPAQGLAHQIYAPELPLAADNGSLTLAMAWGLALALVSAAGTIAAIRWSRRAFLLATVPLVVAILWNLYESLAALLPNLY